MLTHSFSMLKNIELPISFLTFKLICCRDRLQHQISVEQIPQDYLLFLEENNILFMLCYHRENSQNISLLAYYYLSFSSNTCEDKQVTLASCRFYLASEQAGLHLRT